VRRTIMICAVAGLALISNFCVAAPDPNYLDEKPTQKLAFVVGNSDYDLQAKIPSAAVDAKNVSLTLSKLGFSVTTAYNVPNSSEFWEIYFRPFLKRIKANDFVIVYFSGHGLSYGGENYIAMSAFPRTVSEETMLDYLVPLSSLRDLTKKAGLSLFLLDACRNISGSIQRAGTDTIDAIEKGLMDPRVTAESVAIGFSSAQGQVSLGRDAPDVMSYYTAALLQFLPEDGKELGYVRRQTRLKVMSDTGYKQIPWFSESLSAEVYLSPMPQNLAGEKIAWQTRLDSKNRELIANFVFEYPTSRYVAAAKRWLEQNKAPTQNTTKLSPQSIDFSYVADDPTKRVNVPRIDGPFSFNSVELSAVQSSAVSTDIGAVLGQYGSVVVTRPLSARASPTEKSETLTTVHAGQTLAIEKFTENKDGLWLGFDNNGTTAFLPAGRAQIGTAFIGFSIGELTVGPGGGLESLVDEGPIRDGVEDLKAKGRSISRVSIATNSTNDLRLRRKLAGRAAHTSYILQQLGVPPGAITSITLGSTDADRSIPDNDLVRIRFFGH
jgi:hypothetical protein